MRKRLIWLLLLVLALPVPICAAGTGAMGSLRVVLQHAGESVSGGVLTLYSVGEPDAEGFRLKPGFMKSGADLAPAHWTEAAETLASFAQNRGIEGLSKPVEGMGIVSFDDLEDGLYLLIQSEPTPGYQPIRPFLLAIPQEINGTLLHHIEATPKMRPDDPTEPELPQTGQVQWPIPVLLTLGGSLMVVGFAGRRRNEEE